MNEEKHFYLDYIRRTEKIRTLSSPSLDGIKGADEYSRRLHENFVQIGQLASENRIFLESVLYPMIRKKKPLSSWETSEMISFGRQLMSAMDVENLDLPILYKISDRLLADARNKKDLPGVLHRLDKRMDTCYALMLVMGRIHPSPEIVKQYQKEGMEIGKYFLSLLDKDTFAGLPDDECRELALTDARYLVVFYEGFRRQQTRTHEELQLLEKLLEIEKDDFYIRLVPEFDWEYYKYRVLNYYSKCTDYGNLWNYDAGQLSVICDRTEDFVRFWESNRERFSQYDNPREVGMLQMRNRYLAGRIDRRTYYDSLITMYGEREKYRYDLNGIYDNLYIPSEFLCLLDPANLSDEDARNLSGIYHDMIWYACRMPNTGSLSSMLEYYVEILDRFIELPGGISFEEMVLQCIAALHPPTYIHSVMVAELTRYLCDYLIDKKPELFINDKYCGTREEVLHKKEEITSFAYHAGICHDFGKLSIIDTIFVYGRGLLDMEFELIRTHPETGYYMLLRYESTRRYADAACGHHRWYDNSRGYPENFDINKSSVKTIIHLVQCSDCMDAATDRAGRCYNKGKTIEEFIDEVKKESGSRYAPWLSEILDDPAAVKGLNNILTEGRRRIYCDTYELLHGMKESE